MSPRGLAALALGAAAVLLTPAAGAYSIESAITDGCHEQISVAALRAVRADGGLGPPIAADRDGLALIGDLPFTLDDDVRDLAAASFLIGIRDNDLKGRGAMEIDQLALVHGNPNAQREHCLRSKVDDEPDGAATALEDCKAFIRDRFGAALEGLDASGAPDPNRLVALQVHLDLRGKVTAKLPLFWVTIGQTLHAVQDSFAHTFRSEDRTHVRTVLNWVDWVDGHEEEARDGPVHRRDLDACRKLDDLRTRNLEVATAATKDFLRTALDPTLAKDAKLARVDQLLGQYLSYDLGCDEANGWCSAPESQYAIAPSCGCDVVGRSSAWAATALVATLALAVVAMTRRRRGRVIVFAGVTAVPLTARADDPPAPPEPALDVAPPPAPPTSEEVKAAKREEVKEFSRWALYGAASGSITNPSLNAQIGGRFALSRSWVVGVDGELNGWYGVYTDKFRAGAFNAYGTLIHRTPLRFASFNLRTTVNAGASISLTSLYGVPGGTVGLYGALTPLGLEWKVSHHFFVIFDALGVAVPIPQLRGVPFAYPQYRTAVGIELAL